MQVDRNAYDNIVMELVFYSKVVFSRPHFLPLVIPIFFSLLLLVGDIPFFKLRVNSLTKHLTALDEASPNAVVIVLVAIAPTIPTPVIPGD